MKIIITINGEPIIINLDHVINIDTTTYKDEGKTRYQIIFSYVRTQTTTFNFASRAERDLVMENITKVLKPINCNASSRDIYNVEQDR